jgi:hypothetical protein
MKRAQEYKKGKTKNTVHNTNRTNSIIKLVIQCTEAVQAKEKENRRIDSFGGACANAYQICILIRIGKHRWQQVLYGVTTELQTSDGIHEYYCKGVNVKYPGYICGILKTN